MANQSLFVYEGMEDAARFYGEKATDIRDLVTAIKGRNDQLVSSEWNGDSAVAFQQRFESDHAVKMNNIAEALDDIAKTINELVASRQQWEQEQASKFGG